MSEKEIFSWGKLFRGLVNPINFFKSLVSMIQMSIIILVIMAVVFSGFKLYNWAMGKKRVTPDETTIISHDGTVNNESDKSIKNFGLINF